VPPRPRAVPGSTLGARPVRRGPPHANTPPIHTSSSPAAQRVRLAADSRHCQVTGPGASSAPDYVALQGRPVKGAPSGRVAKAMAQVTD